MAGEKPDPSVFRFEQDFQTGGYRGLHMGRLYLRNAVVRIHFDHTGLRLVIPKSAIADGSVIIHDDTDA